MNSLPPLHPEWLVSFWYDTPLLNMLNPHYTLAAAAAAGILVFIVKKRHGPAEPDDEESVFRHLLNQKRVINEQIQMLDARRRRGELPLADYETEMNRYNELMEKVSDDIKQYL